MSDPSKVHPRRRKARRGKRGGKKHNRAPAVETPPTPPSTLLNLRKRLSTLATKHG